MKLGSWSQRPLAKIIVIAAALLVLLLVDRQIVRLNGDMFNRDFFSLWGGGRALLDGVDAYDQDAWAELHVRYGAYWLENPIYIYPPPIAILFIPLALLPVPLAATVWELVSQVMLVLAIVALVVGLEGRRSLVAVLIPLVFLSRPAIVIATSGQLSAVWPLSLCLFYLFVRRKRSILAGGILALLLLRPSVSLILLPAALVWLLVQRMGRGLLAFAVLSAVGLALSLVVCPGWLERWLAFILAKRGHYTPAVATLWGLAHDLFAGRFPAGVWQVVFGVTAALLVGACIWATIRVRDLHAPAFLLACAACLTLSISPYAWPYDQILLLFPLGVILAQGDRLGKKYRLLVWGGAFMVMDVLPYVCLFLAERRGVDTLSALVPLAMLFWLLGVTYFRGGFRRRPLLEQESDA